jgi:DNA adenine methylase
MLIRMAYPGGKSGAGVYQAVINLMPPHSVYIEPFLGGGALIRRKRPASLNIGIDRDAEAIRAVTESGIAEPGDTRFRFEIGDALAFLQSYPFAGDELVYCDPPYMHHARGRTDYYRFEMNDLQHAALLDVIKDLPCRVMISGYWTELYGTNLKAWNTSTFQAMTRAGRTATEWLWYNFPAPVALHDYQFLGADFRQRERIKRKKQRWTDRLSRLPLLERQALLAAIEETWRGPPS